MSHIYIVAKSFEVVHRDEVGNVTRRLEFRVGEEVTLAGAYPLGPTLVESGHLVSAEGPAPEPGPAAPPPPRRHAE
jgi:hypothetical protein